MLKKQRNSRKTSTSAPLIILKCLTMWITTNWKILQKMGMPDNLTCLLRNLHAGQEATGRSKHGTKDWLKIWKGVHQGCISSPCLFNLCEVTGLMKHKMQSRLPGEITMTSDMQMTPPLWVESEEKLKHLFMEMKEESEKADLKLNT